MSVPQTLDGFDIPLAVERMIGDPGLWWQAVVIFVGHFAGWVQAWEACIGEDAKEQKIVHALRSAAANVGAIGLVGHAARLEDYLLMRLAGKTEPVPEALRRDLLIAFRRTWGAASDACRPGRPGTA